MRPTDWVPPSHSRVVPSGTVLAAIDLFCGVGGLSFGLQQAGISVVAGFDLDPACEFPFEANIGASFVEKDVRHLKAEHLTTLWPAGQVRVLAGCAPCQPFSPYRRGADTSHEADWELLREFGRLVSATTPEIVSMENVTRLGSTRVFQNFVRRLRRLGYHIDCRSCHGPEFGLPQNRRRLMLLASLLGPIELPHGNPSMDSSPTVRHAIGGLPAIRAGEVHGDDPLHRARDLSAVNLRRIRASTPGGTWMDWPRSLRAPCHQKESGASFKNVYARMEWDKPAPTITTLFHNFGTGRFGHPEQDRPISIREAAMLQGFPKDYAFVRPGSPVSFTHQGRLIGNAVPPPMAAALGATIVSHVKQHGT
jgi:DNA (cytosine-5)-methyltransferase 1